MGTMLSMTQGLLLWGATWTCICPVRTCLVFLNYGILNYYIMYIKCNGFLLYYSFMLYYHDNGFSLIA